nr:P2Y purinoceptor 1-like isoform X2 [Pelodiscus sinensis]|eukprot:XP_006111554.1 P2Y purinoceptor 1-like isoform X2 [Pelodiscus sinensis]
MRMVRTAGQKAEADFCGSAVSILGTIQRTLIPGTFLFILVVGLTLNVSVIWVLVFRVKRWNRSTVFLCNLVLADITWILTLPFLIYYHLHQLHWIFGDALCGDFRDQVCKIASSYSHTRIWRTLQQRTSVYPA